MRIGRPAGLAVLLACLAVGAAAAAGAPPGAIDLSSGYPNLREVASGFYLSGSNAYTPGGAARTVLWFESFGHGRFRQYDYMPFERCHYDELRWTASELDYRATSDHCRLLATDITYRPAIVFMPRTWARGTPWSSSGASAVVYAEDGVAVCAGTNTWVSHVVGLSRTPGGGTAVHTRTNETQVLTAIGGAASSAACPVGQTVESRWQENFYVQGELAVTTTAGEPVGVDTALVRSVGGSATIAQQTGHPEWDAQFAGWLPLPGTPPAALAASAVVLPVGGRLHLDLHIVDAQGAPLVARVRLALLADGQPVATSAGSTDDGGWFHGSAPGPLQPGCYGVQVLGVHAAGHRWNGIGPAATACLDAAEVAAGSAPVDLTPSPRWYG